MNCKRYFSVILLLVDFVVVSFGQAQISRAEAVKASVNTLKRNNPNKATLSEDSVDSVFKMVRNGNTLLYEVLFSSGERVLLSGHRGCQPVLGFFDINTASLPPYSIFSDNGEIPNGMKTIVWQYADQIDYCFLNAVGMHYREQWDSLLRDYDVGKTVATVIIPPLLTTEWGQQCSNDATNPDTYAYNARLDTNPIPGCMRCLAGCGAVAMAQILKYWKSPTSVPFNCIHYSWVDMPDKLIKNGNPNYVNQRDAVSTLIKHCGMISNTNYCSGFNNDPCASSNNIYNSEDGFHLYGFVNADIVTRGNNDTDWTNMMFQELFNNRPVYYTAYQTSSWEGGHAFVCDGYYKDALNNEYFYFNWGWNGNHNFYPLTLSNLAPPGYSFNYHHQAIIDVYPTNCFQHIIMECDNNFAHTAIRTLSAVEDFSNNFHIYNINSGAKIYLHAGNEILLTDGFYAQQGSRFEATITPCSSSTTSPPDYIVDDSNEDSTADTLLAPKSLQTEASSANDATLSVHPNPTSDLLFVELRGAEIANVALYDLQGRVVTGVCDTPQQGATATLNVKSVPTGVYLLRVKDTDGKEYHRKIVKR